MDRKVVNQQWSTRPEDQRFLTLSDLHRKVSERRAQYTERVVALDECQVESTQDGAIVLADTVNGPALTTHWAFGQLCARAKAPASYLRSLPAELAVPALQWSMETHEASSDEGRDGKLLVQRNGQSWLRAVTSSTYGRIYDAEVTGALLARIDTSVWKVPAASYSGTDPLRATTLYASDHDVFVFLVDESRAIEIDGERLNRGVIVSNSETGAAAFSLATFTYDHVCDNRIIWDMGHVAEMRIRHTSGGPHRYLARAVPALEHYARSSGHLIEATVRTAKATTVGKNRAEVLEWMRKKGFTTPQAAKAYDAAEADPRGYDPRTVWALVQGVTDSAHNLAHTDSRVDLETKAGDLLSTIAKDVPAKELRSY